MLGGKNRSRLESLRGRIIALLRALPEGGAKRLRSTLENLERDVAAATSPWWPWLPRIEVLEGLEERFKSLSKAAEPLGELIAAARGLQAEIGPLIRRGEDLADADVKAWLRELSNTWSARLQRVGADISREAELGRGRELIENVERELRTLARALPWLVEAEALTGRFGSDPQAAPLVADLPELKRELVEKGASDGWIQTIKALVEPLRERALRVENPPSAVPQISRRLADLRGWARALGESGDEVEGLERRHRFSAADWSEADLETLDHESGRLLTEAIARAEALRKQQLSDLDGQIGDLLQICGPQPDLQSDLAELERMDISTHQGFKTWQARHERLNDRFRALATNYEGPLEIKLSDLSKSVASGLERLRSKPLSETVEAGADRLEVELSRLVDATGAEALLTALRLRGGLESQLAALSDLAQDELEDLSRQQASLLAENLDLKEQALRVGFEVASFEQRIDDLDESAAVSSLEEARQLSRKLATDLAAERSRFVAWCLDEFTRRGVALERLASILKSSGTTVSPHPGPFDPEAEPTEAAAALAAITQRATELSALVEQALTGCEARRTALLGALDRLAPEGLSPEDRETTVELREELSNGTWSEAESAGEKLRRLAATVRKGDDLFARLKEEESRIREMLASLRLRLKKLGEDDLRSLCPDLAERAAGLVFGIPKSPTLWRAVAAQLAVAQALLLRAETHATRRAATELADAVEILRTAAAQSKDPELETLLAELAASPAGALPAPSLRRQVASEARQQTLGRRVNEGLAK